MEIFEGLKAHYEDAEKHFAKDKIIGLFLQGSQNYNLSYEGSDIDTKLIIAPSFSEIVLNKTPVSTTFVRENNEHIDFKDVRLYMECFKKQNINFLEILFTDYYILNSDYADIIEELIQYREEIAHYDMNRTIKASMGVASEKHFALTHRYPSRIPIIDAFGGYDPKQLSHLVRVHDFMSKYAAGASFEEAMHPTGVTRDTILDIKINGVKNLETALALSEQYFNKCKAIHDNFILTPREINKNALKILDGAQCELVRRALKKDLDN